MQSISSNVERAAREWQADVDQLAEETIEPSAGQASAAPRAINTPHGRRSLSKSHGWPIAAGVAVALVLGISFAVVRNGRGTGPATVDRAGVRSASVTSTNGSPVGRATRPGPRLHVAADGECPKSTEAAVDVEASTGVGPHLLATNPEPNRILICGYQVDQQTIGRVPPHLTLSRRATGTEAGRLAHAIRAISLTPGSNIPQSCPGSVTSPVYVLAVGYPNRADVDLWYSAHGCRTIDNGDVLAVWNSNPAFYDAFSRVFLRFLRSK